MILEFYMYLDRQFLRMMLSIADGIWCFYRRCEMVNNGLAHIVGLKGRVKDKQNSVV